MIDSFDIATINAARFTMRRIVAKSMEEIDADVTGWERDALSYARGFLGGQAEQADEILFGMLNYAKHHLKVPVTDEQLFNRLPGETS